MSVDPLTERIVDRVRETFTATVSRSVSRTWREVPDYPASMEDSLLVDLTAHTESVFEAVLTSLTDGRRATGADFPITASQARRRVRQGVTLPDFLTGFRIGQETLWEAIVEAASPEQETRDAALHLAIHVMNVIEVGSSLAASAYLVAKQLDLAEGDRISRDLADDLLAGRDLPPGPGADLAALTDLTRDSRLVVVTAVPTGPVPGDRSLREVVSALRTLGGAGGRGVAVVRQDEVVGVIPVRAGGAVLVAGLRATYHGLARHGLALTMAVSAIHDGLRAVPAAYDEAVLARASLAGAAGVQALTELSPLEYLLLLGDPTAERLIGPRIRSFVEDDRRSGGDQVVTLRAYAASNLNARMAAEQLHIHVNTAYYRLDQIAQRTGRDPRVFAELQELLVAIDLLSGTCTAASGDGAARPAPLRRS